VSVRKRISFEQILELKKDYPDVDIEPLIADVQQKRRIDGIFKTYHPDVVFHAAAHKHVYLMEITLLRRY
jgi:FlaA1/EpsC-like NDP-sugar epimerase